MLRLKRQIADILSSAERPKSVAAETDLILYHFFREEMKTGVPPVSAQTEALAIEIAQKRASGVPLQHLLGYQFFYEHEYEVGPTVLIPRPETEILVQAAIGWIQTHGGSRLAELGLGSGAISGEILSACPQIRGVASELSPEAQSIARRNLERVLGSSWTNRLKILTPELASVGFEIFIGDAPFDLIVSNPPYVAREDEIEEEVQMYEPHLALFPDAVHEGRSANYFYESFMLHARKILRVGGVAFLEVPHERADFLASLPLAAGIHAELLPDLTGRSRVLKCTF